MGFEALRDPGPERQFPDARADRFETLYDEFFSRVYNYVRYQVKDPHVTDDIVSRIFEKVLLNLESYRPEQAPLAHWLFTICRNAVRDHAREMKRHRHLPLEAVPERAAPGPTPEEAAVRRESLDRVLRAVARLSSREREIIGLKFAAGFTNRSIAKLCGLREQNVAVILHRAVRRIRRDVTDGEEQCHDA